MNASLFLTQVKEWWSTITGKITTTINEKKKADTYLHEGRLTPEYSIDGKYDGASMQDSVVAADIVATESPYPVKSRPSMGKFSGKIVKLAIKKTLGEDMIQKINTLLAIKKVVEAIKALFDDAGKCVLGIKEQVELLFLQALSTGFITIAERDDDGELTGNSVRIKFNYPSSNHFGVGVKWGVAGATPISDIKRVLAANESITIAWMRTSTMNLIRNSYEGMREGARSKLGYYPEDNQLSPMLRQEFLDFMQSEYNLAIRLVDRKVRIERKNGRRVDIQPFEGGAVVFMEQDADLGRLVYATLAEETNPVDGVTYAKFEEYIQLAQHSELVKDTPVEVTRAHARVLPVIDGAEQIYLLNHQEINEDLAPEEDEPTVELEEIESTATAADFTVDADNFAVTKAALIGAGVTVSANTTNPATLQAKVAALTSSEWTDFVSIYNNTIANS